MAAAITAHYELRLDVEETLALSQDLAAAETTFTQKMTETTRGTLNATSTPAVTKAFNDKINLSGGTAALDLTSLTGPAATSITFDGLKVQVVKLACPSSNTAGITVAKKDASTGYNLFGADNVSSESVEVLPGASVAIYHDDETEDVDSTHKDITFTGTGTEAIEIQLVAG